jgi:hypothetical protein
MLHPVADSRRIPSNPWHGRVLAATAEPRTLVVTAPPASESLRPPHPRSFLPSPSPSSRSSSRSPSMSLTQRSAQTIPARVTARLVFCLWLVCGFCLTACSSSPPSHNRDAAGRPDDGLASAMQTAPIVPGDLSASTEVPAPPSPGFDYPADMAPYLIRILAPETPALPPAVRQAHQPQPKAGPLPAARWDPAPSLRLASPALRGTKSDIRPPYPAERFSPAAVFTAAQPPKTTLPTGPGITTRAPDPAIPPPLPSLSRFSSERVGFEDPTADNHHSFLLSPRLGVPLPPVPFEKTEIPDPQVLGEQIRPQLSPPLEPGRRPDSVPPPRPPAP